MSEMNSFTVKEILTDMVLPRLEAIEKAAGARADAIELRIDGVEKKQADLFTWRDRLAGAVAIIGAVLVPVAIPLVIAVFSGVNL